MIWSQTVPNVVRACLHLLAADTAVLQQHMVVSQPVSQAYERCVAPCWSITGLSAVGSGSWRWLQGHEMK